MVAQKLTLELNNILRSTPLAVTWLDSCAVPTENGFYRPADVCTCFMLTGSALSNRIFALDTGSIGTDEADSRAEDFEQLLDDLAVRREAEVDAAILCAETVAECEGDASGVQDLLQRLELSSASLNGPSRAMTALAAMISIICVHMAVLFGSGWMDSVSQSSEAISEYA